MYDGRAHGKRWRSRFGVRISDSSYRRSRYGRHEWQERHGMPSSSPHQKCRWALPILFSSQSPWWIGTLSSFLSLPDPNFRNQTNYLPSFWKLESLLQTSNEDENNFSSIFEVAAYRCGNVQMEVEKISIFVNGLFREKFSFVSRFWCDQPRTMPKSHQKVSYARA